MIETATVASLLESNKRVHEAERELAEAAEERRQLIRGLLNSGFTQSQVGDLLGVSQPRISTMMKARA